MVKTRFAPSPTGNLHIGGARTALFNYLYAGHNRGTFVLRIEDTDVERSKEEYVQDILGGLTWLGIVWDEGLFQKDRMNLYREQAYSLLEKGWAYKCYCSAEVLEEKRQAALREGRNPPMTGPAGKGHRSRQAGLLLSVSRRPCLVQSPLMTW